MEGSAFWGNRGVASVAFLKQYVCTCQNIPSLRTLKTGSVCLPERGREKIPLCSPFGLCTGQDRLSQRHSLTGVKPGSPEISHHRSLPGGELAPGVFFSSITKQKGKYSFARWRARAPRAQGIVKKVSSKNSSFLWLQSSPSQEADCGNPFLKGAGKPHIGR